MAPRSLRHSDAACDEPARILLSVRAKLKRKRGCSLAQGIGAATRRIDVPCWAAITVERLADPEERPSKAELSRELRIRRGLRQFSTAGIMGIENRFRAIGIL